jgi:hypothetical protein
MNAPSTMPGGERDKSLRYQRNLMGVIIALAAAGSVGLALWFPETPAYAAGWALGAIAGLAIFRHRAVTVLSLFDRPREEWHGACIKASLAGYAIMIAAVVAALFIDEIDPYATAAGLLLERFVLRADGWLRPAALSEENDPGALAEEAHS